MNNDYIKLFKDLLERVKKDLAEFPKPIVRVSGTLTTCNREEEEKTHRVHRAQAILRQSGYNVFDYDKYQEIIFNEGYEHCMHGSLIHYFHKPILTMNCFEAIYFLPEWQESAGARWEHRYISKHTNIKVVHFEEEWFANEEIV